MTLEEIKNAVRSGKKVYWANKAYEVLLHHLKNGSEQWLITCNINNHSIGLTWLDGITLNGKESEFFIG